MIISHIQTKDAGFFSSFFFMVNHYIYGKLNNTSFKLVTDKWLFKYEKGWEDYFLPIDFYKKNNNQIEKVIYDHAIILDNYPWKMYCQMIPHIYKYNSKTETIINTSKNILSWATNEYATIFIRRGDKLITESILIPSENYLLYLLELYPECNKVFLQTDDYNVFLELIEYKEKHPNLKHIDIQTFCKKECVGGMVITMYSHNYYTKTESTQQPIMNLTQQYTHNNLEHLKKYKPLEMQTPTEVYEHTMDMLIGIDMVFHGRICITDYQSNVTRFVKLGHPNMDSVYDIIRRTNLINLYNTKCPAYNCFYSFQ